MSSLPQVLTPLVGTAVVEMQGALAPCVVHASSSLDDVWAALPDLATVDRELDEWGIPGVGGNLQAEGRALGLVQSHQMGDGTHL